MAKGQLPRTIIGNVILNKKTCSTRQLFIRSKKIFKSYISDCNGCRIVSLYDAVDTGLSRDYIETVSRYLFITAEQCEDRDSVTCLYSYNGKGGFSLIDEAVGPRGYAIDYLIFKHCELFGFSNLEKIELLLEIENYLKGKVIACVNENLDCCHSFGKYFNTGIFSREDTIFFCFNNSPVKDVVEAYIEEYHPVCFYIDKYTSFQWSVHGESISEITENPTSVIEDYI